MLSALLLPSGLTPVSLVTAIVSFVGRVSRLGPVLLVAVVARLVSVIR